MVCFLVSIHAQFLTFPRREQSRSLPPKTTGVPTIPPRSSAGYPLQLKPEQQLPLSCIPGELSTSERISTAPKPIFGYYSARANLRQIRRAFVPACGADQSGLRDTFTKSSESWGNVRGAFGGHVFDGDERRRVRHRRLLADWFVFGLINNCRESFTTCRWESEVSFQVKVVITYPSRSL